MTYPPQQPPRQAPQPLQQPQSQSQKLSQQQQSQSQKLSQQQQSQSKQPLQQPRQGQGEAQRHLFGASQRPQPQGLPLGQKPRGVLRPLLNLPEPPMLPRGSAIVDVPEEILLDSRRELRDVAGYRAYVRMSITGALVWSLLALLFVGGISSMLWLAVILGLLNIAFLSAFFQSLGLSIWSALGIIAAAPLLGALIGAGTVPLAMWSVSRLRPREYISERAFRKAIGRCFAKWQALPQIVAVLGLFVAVILPLPYTAWKDVSFLVVSILALMYVVIVVGFVVNIWQGTAANVLRLPKISELEIRTQTAPSAQEFVRYAAIMHGQDRRHLPPNSFRFEWRALWAALAAMLRHRTWAFVIAAVLCSMIYYVADLAQVFGSMSMMSTASPLDPQAGPDFSVLAMSTVLLVAVLWCAMAALIPPLVVKFLPRGTNPATDLRTYPTVKERLEVNAWERRAVWTVAVLFAVAEYVLLAFLVLMCALGGDLGGANTAVFVLAGFVLIPIGVFFTHRAMALDLRTVVYGPFGWFARRASPFAAIVPRVGTKAELAEDPMVRAEMLERQAKALGLDVTASPEAVARAAAMAGVLPDFGMGEPAKVVLSVEDPRDPYSHEIPRGLDELT